MKIGGGGVLGWKGVKIEKLSTLFILIIIMWHLLFEELNNLFFHNIFF